MPTSHSNAGFVDLNPVLCRKGLGYFLRDFKIGAQVVCCVALRQLDQPPRVSNKHRLIGRCDCPELVEDALNLRQPIADATRSGVPQAQTQQFKAPYDIQIEQGVRVPDTPIATRPTRLLPQMKDPAS